MSRAARERDRTAGDPGATQRKYRQSPTARLQVFYAWKAQQSCVRCGYKADPQRLHFHHRDPATKLYKISRMIYRYGLTKLWTEVAKCDLLCVSCHEAEHGAHRFRD